MQTFSVEAAFRFGWETFKKRPGFFVGVVIILALVSWIVGFIVGMFGENGGGFIGGVANLLISTLLDLGVVAVMLKTYDAPDAPQFADLWHPQGYLPYLAATVLTGIAIAIGFVLLVIPGIIAMLMFLFVKFLVVDRNLGPIEAMKESMRITKGHRWTLLLFVLAIAAINIIGAILLLVGLLVTIPVSYLAMVYAYRTIGHTASEVVPAPASTPSPISAPVV